MFYFEGRVLILKANDFTHGVIMIERQALRACLSSSLEFYHISRLGALGSIDNIKTHRLTFGKGLESLILNVSIVHKHISAVFFADESEALGFIEPLNISVCHDYIPFFLVFEG